MWNHVHSFIGDIILTANVSSAITPANARILAVPGKPVAFVWIRCLHSYGYLFHRFIHNAPIIYHYTYDLKASK